MSITSNTPKLLIELAVEIDCHTNWMIRTQSEPMLHQTLDVVKEAILNGDDEITISRINDYLGEDVTEHSITIENGKYKIDQYCQGMNYCALPMKDMVQFIKDLYVVDLNKND